MLEALSDALSRGTAALDAVLSFHKAGSINFLYALSEKFRYKFHAKIASVVI